MSLFLWQLLTLLFLSGWQNFLINFPFGLTHRLSLADQELVKLLQQGRLPNDLSAHVGVPGLLIRIPGRDRHSVSLSLICVNSVKWLHVSVLCNLWINYVRYYQLRGCGASIFWPSMSSSWISLKYLSFRQWRISLAWLAQVREEIWTCGNWGIWYIW